MKRAFSLALSLLLVAIFVVTPTFVSAQEDTGIEVFVTEDGAYGAFLPDGWVASGSREEGIAIASSEEALALLLSGEEEASLPSGEVGLFAVALDAITLEALGISEETSLTDAVNILIELIAADSLDTVQIGEASEIDFEGIPAATVDVSDTNVDLVFYTYQFAPGTLALAYGAAASGELESAREIIAAVLSGVGYSLPLTETFDSEILGATVPYPTDWLASDEDGYFALAIDQATLDSVEALTEGQYGFVMVAIPSQLDVVDVANQLAVSVAPAGAEASDAVLLSANGEPVGAAVFTSETGDNEGGVFVAETSTGVVAIAYLTANGESNYVSFTAFSIAISVE